MTAMYATIDPLIFKQETKVTHRPLKTIRQSMLSLGAGLAAIMLTSPGALAQQPNAKIGLFLELTGGSASTTSEASQFGVELAVQEINAAGGIGGRKLQLVVADTQTDPTVGVGEIKRLVQQEKVDFVFGPPILTGPPDYHFAVISAAFG